MQDFIHFVGRFHVLALHLPIGILVVAVIVDWVSRRERNAALARVAPFLWTATAVSAVATAALGYLHLSEGGFGEGSASAHRFFGSALAAFTVLVAWLCARRPPLYRRINVVTGVVALALVSVTGHYGGNLTHGDTFLLQYAPAFLRAAASPPGDNSRAYSDETTIDRLYASGFLVRQVSDTDRRLVVSVYSPGARLAREHIAALEAAADQIVELNLQDAGLDDDELANLSKFTGLTRLRLSRNSLTDRTVAAFASMPNLERLNLYANSGITDSSIDALAALKSLRRLDVWRTRISEEGMARLRALRPDLELQGETTTDVITGPDVPDRSGAR
jgi:uncharacterized membrane protein/DNA-binding MarR family transcriptional regulator